MGLVADHSSVQISFLVPLAAILYITWTALHERSAARVDHMQTYANDSRIVMTLDAGGTNFVFSAMRANRPVVASFALPSNADNLERSLANIVEGFGSVREQLAAPPVAISFAFPAPADYFNGIIVGPGNLPAYRDVPLGPMLEDHFGLPTFINNDGDLFAYGEATAGFLPYVNGLLEKAGSPKRYRNLLGVTLGTGLRRRHRARRRAVRRR